MLSSEGDDGNGVSTTLSSLPSVDVRRAVDIGQSFANNVTNSVRRNTGKVHINTRYVAKETFKRRFNFLWLLFAKIAGELPFP